MTPDVRTFIRKTKYTLRDFCPLVVRPVLSVSRAVLCSLEGQRTQPRPSRQMRASLCVRFARRARCPRFFSAYQQVRAEQAPLGHKLAIFLKHEPGCWRVSECCNPPRLAYASGARERNFHDAADELLQHALECVEAVVDKEGLDVDVSLADGVLTIDCGSVGVFVLNKQTPNNQIWLASPVSGPLRYDYTADGEWLNTRDGHDLQQRLTHEIESMWNVRLKM